MGTDNSIKLTVSYSRVSTDVQEQQKTIESQLFEIQKYAKEHSIEIAKDFKDDGVSGASLDRPGLDELRDWSKEGRIERVIIYDQDRLSRNLAQQLFLDAEFTRRGVELVFITSPASGNEITDKIVKVTKGLIADIERLQIIERTRRGKLSKARKGELWYPSGQAHFGYDFHKKVEGLSKDVVVNEQEAKTVVRMFNWVLEGNSIRGIALKLKSLKIPTKDGKETWGTSSVSRVLRYEGYLGHFFYNKLGSKSFDDENGKKKTLREVKPKTEWVEIPRPELAIISQDIFDRVQKRLTFNRHTHPTLQKHQYLLSGLVKCGLCHSSYYSTPIHAYPYYRCASRHSVYKDGRCTNKMISATKLDKAVWNEVVKESKKLLKRGKSKQIGKMPAAYMQITHEVKRLEKEIEELNGQETHIADAFSRKILPENHYFQQFERITRERSELQKELKEKQALVSQRSFVFENETQVGDYVERMSKYFESPDFESKRKLVQELVEKVVIQPEYIEVSGVFDVSLSKDFSNGDSSNIFYRWTSG